MIDLSKLKEGDVFYVLEFYKNNKNKILCEFEYEPQIVKYKVFNESRYDDEIIAFPVNLNRINNKLTTFEQKRNDNGNIEFTKNVWSRNIDETLNPIFINKNKKRLIYDVIYDILDDHENPFFDINEADLMVKKLMSYL